MNFTPEQIAHARIKFEKKFPLAEWNEKIQGYTGIPYSYAFVGWLYSIYQPKDDQPSAESDIGKFLLGLIAEPSDAEIRHAARFVYGWYMGGESSADAASAVEPVVWPFVESPGAFAERLKVAMQEFDLLGAVRHVLIEKPAKLSAPPAPVAIPTSISQRAAELIAELEALDVPDILLKQMNHALKMSRFLREIATPSPECAAQPQTTKLEPLAHCCYGGMKTKSQCQSCGYWGVKPVKPQTKSDKEIDDAIKEVIRPMAIQLAKSIVSSLADCGILSQFEKDFNAEVLKSQIPSSLVEQIQNAQQEIAAWPEGKAESVRLEGDATQPQEGKKE